MVVIGLLQIVAIDIVVPVFVEALYAIVPVSGYVFAPEVLNELSYLLSG